MITTTATTAIPIITITKVLKPEDSLGLAVVAGVPGVVGPTVVDGPLVTVPPVLGVVGSLGFEVTLPPSPGLK